MRSFIAISLPPPIQTYLTQLQDELKAAGADVKWVEPANIHLTLKFLGEINEQILGKVNTAMRETCAGMKPFALSLASLGAFPSTNSPRVIWIGIQEGKDEATAVADRLEKKLVPLGMIADHPFAAHITLGRVRTGKNRKELAQKLQQPLPGETPVSFLVDRITLYESKLSPHGPTYLNHGDVPFSL